MKISHFQKKVLIYIAVPVVTVIILTIPFIILKNDITKKSVKITQRKVELADRTLSIKSLVSLKKENEKAIPYYSLLENILPSKDKIISISKEIESLARKEGIGYSFSFGTEKKSTTDQPGTTGFRMTIQGSSSGFINFLKDIEGGRYLLSFSTINMDKRGDRYDIIILGDMYSR